MYTLEEDLDHAGFEDAPRPAVPQTPAVVWEHRLTEPIPDHLPQADGSVDEVRLEGTCNAKRLPTVLFAEIFRVLRPGGKVALHGLVGNQALETPALPGLAALVQRVPAISEVLDTLQQAGFTGLFYETLGDITCISVGSLELREMRLLGWKPATGNADKTHRVLYKGPLASVCDEHGTLYERGRIVPVSASVWQALQEGPTAGQFALLPPVS